jgi:hypothetical protein
MQTIKMYSTVFSINKSIYSEREKYGINSLKIKQNLFQKILCADQF